MLFELLQFRKIAILGILEYLIFGKLQYFNFGEIEMCYFWEIEICHFREIEMCHFQEIEMCHFREIEMCHIREMVMRHFREIIFGRLKCEFRNNAFRVFKNYFKNYSNYYNYFFIIHIQIPLAKSRSERGASYHPAFMVSSLTISQTRLLCPPCGKMGLQSWTVEVRINKL